MLRAVYLARSDAELNAATPVGGAAATALRSFVGDVGLECRMRIEELRVDPTDPEAPARLDAELRAATARNEVVLVIGAPADGADPVQRLLQHAASGTDWRGGVVVLGDAGAGVVTAPLPTTPQGSEPVLVTRLAGTPTESRLALTLHIAELQRRVVSAGAVQRHVAEDGPQHRPHVAGPRELDRP